MVKCTFINFFIRNIQQNQKLTNKVRLVFLFVIVKNRYFAYVIHKTKRKTQE